eukprot:3400720-Rhodomonas_salina.2
MQSQRSVRFVQSCDWKCTAVSLRSDAVPGYPGTRGTKESAPKASKTKNEKKSSRRRCAVDAAGLGVSARP